MRKSIVLLLFIVLFTGSCQKHSGTTYWKIASFRYDTPDTKGYLYKDLGYEMSANPKWKLAGGQLDVYGFEYEYEEGFEYIVEMKWIAPKGTCTEYHYVKTISKVETDTEVLPEDINLDFGDICY